MGFRTIRLRTLSPLSGWRSRPVGRQLSAVSANNHRDVDDLKYPIAWVSVNLFAMPTVLRFDAYRAVIYTNDHRPAHVHVIGPQGRAIFELNGPKGPPTVRDSRLPPTELAKIKAVLQQHLAELCEAWGKIHGYP